MRGHNVKVKDFLVTGIGICLLLLLFLGWGWLRLGILRPGAYQQLIQEGAVLPGKIVRCAIIELNPEDLRSRRGPKLGVTVEYRQPDGSVHYLGEVWTADLSCSEGLPVDVYYGGPNRLAASKNHPMMRYRKREK